MNDVLKTLDAFATAVTGLLPQLGGIVAHDRLTYVGDTAVALVEACRAQTSPDLAAQASAILSEAKPVKIDGRLRRQFFALPYEKRLGILNALTNEPLYASLPDESTLMKEVLPAIEEEGRGAEFKRLVETV